MSINKNFVVKNGFEVSSDLILANSTTRKVGIASTNPEYLLDVRGGIGATDINITGIGTFIGEFNVGLGGTVLTALNSGLVGIGTENPEYVLDIRSAVSTGQTALYVQGDVRITGDLNVDDITFDDATVQNLTVTDTLYVGGESGIATITTLGVAGLTTTQNLQVTGISTFLGAANFSDGVQVTSGVTTVGTLVATTITSQDLDVTGIATLASVDINAGEIDVTDIETTNLSVTGIATINTISVVGAAFTNLIVTGISSLYGYVSIDNSANISSDLNVTGIATLATVDINAGEIDVTRVETVDLNVTGITSTGSLSIGSTQVISSAFELQNIASLDATTTATIEAAIANAPNTFTDITVTGIATLGITSATSLTAQELNVSGITTLGTTGATSLTSQDLNVSGITTLGITGATSLTSQDLNVSGISTLDIASATSLTSQDLNVSGITTLGTTGTTELTAQELNVSGITTLGILQISSGIVTATSGIITYYGDGQYLENVVRGIGIATDGGLVGSGATVVYFQGPGISTITVTSGIATVNVVGGGGGATIGIGSTPGDAFTGIVTAGNLWYNNNLGRLFIYYQDDDSAQWVDASPFNVGIITSLTNVSFSAGSAISPSMYFVGDNQTGFFSPSAGEFTIVSTGSSILNVNSGGIIVTGIVTATDFDALSDVNYKENVTTINDALDKVEQLRGVRFNWKESGNPSYGVIAQELQEVLPELVHGENPRTVNYNGIIGVLIEAIKELKSEIEELKKNK